MLKNLLFIVFISLGWNASASQILIPMDESQKNHLKAYGVSYWILENDLVIEWLLNYRGGSFMIPHVSSVEEELIIRGVSYEILADGQANSIRNVISSPEKNMEIVQL